MKCKIGKLLLISSVALSALPASAVEPSFQRHNLASFNGKDAFRAMIDTTYNFCYLSAVEFDNADTEGEQPRCEVIRQNGTWVLMAETEGDADARCSSYCYPLHLH